MRLLYFKVVTSAVTHCVAWESGGVEQKNSKANERDHGGQVGCGFCGFGGFGGFETRTLTQARSFVF